MPPIIGRDIATHHPRVFAVVVLVPLKRGVIVTVLRIGVPIFPDYLCCFVTNKLVTICPESPFIVEG
jgi:hypothetical protein